MIPNRIGSIGLISAMMAAGLLTRDNGLGAPARAAQTNTAPAGGACRRNPTGPPRTRTIGSQAQPLGTILTPSTRLRAAIKGQGAAMPAYYNEIEPYAAQWLRNLIAAGHIAPGDVDERSIVDVRPDDLAGYTQCHFFAGIGGWSLAARLAGWDDASELWTGSCPCQPYSVAGKGEGQKDPRHLWPEFFRLIGARRPDVVMGEQVAAAVGKHWLDGVCADLEGIDYAVGAAVVPACAVDAPHKRDRLWFVADADQPSKVEGREQRSGQLGGACRDTSPGPLADAESIRGGAGLREGHSIVNGHGAPSDGSNRAVADSERGMRDGRADLAQREPQRRNATWWSGADWLRAADGKARRVEPGIRLLAHGVPARVGKLRAYGNAIVPQVAAEVIGAYLDMRQAA